MSSCHRRVSWKRYFILGFVGIRTLLSCHDVGASNVLPSQDGGKRRQDEIQIQRRLIPNRRNLRQLAVGDFEELNELVHDVVIKLPDATLSEKPYGLDLTRLQCTHFQIGDIIVSSRKTSDTDALFNIELYGLDMYCTGRYRFEGLLFVYRGDVELTSLENSATMEATVLSTNYNEVPPDKVEVNSCNTTVNINHLDFDDDGILSIVLDRFKRMLRNLFERVAEERICSELETAMEQKIGIEMLSYIKDILAKYNPSNLVMDPLSSETNMIESGMITSSQSLLYFGGQTTDSPVTEQKGWDFGTWVKNVLEEAVNYLGAQVPISGTTDMQVNVLLRELFLQDDRALYVNLKGDRILYSGQDRLTNTTITVDRVRLLGLDTLTKFDPLDVVGNYTLQNQLSWEYLTFQIDLTIQMEPSTSEDAFIVADGNGAGENREIAVVKEQVTLFAGMEGVNALVSVLLAIDRDYLEDIRLGALLTKESIMSCLTTTIFQMELSMLSVDVDNIQVPTMDGFVSDGIDRVLSSTTQGFFLMYESLLLKASAPFCQLTLRELLNEKLPSQSAASRFITLREDTRSCFSSENNQSASEEQDEVRLVDFRDLLLPPEEALRSGGSGNAPYGNFFSSIVIPTFQEKLLSDDAKLNSLIRLFTEKQSGFEGTLSFPAILLAHNTNLTLGRTAETQDQERRDATSEPVVLSAGTLARSGDSSSSSGFPMANSSDSYHAPWSHIQVRASNIRLQNLDIVKSPLVVLEPTGWNVLSNNLTLEASPSEIEYGGGSLDKDLNLTIRLFLAIEGEDSPFQMSNEVDLSISVPSLAISFDLVASILNNALMNFPLGNVTSGQCWLASIARSHQNIMDHEQANSDRLALKKILLSLPSFALDAKCITCSSPGVRSLAEVLRFLVNNAGLAFLFRRRLEHLAEELLSISWHSIAAVDTLLGDAPSLCSRQKNHGERSITATKSGTASSRQLSLSPYGVETILALSWTLVHVSTVLVAKNFLSDDVAGEPQHKTQVEHPAQYLPNSKSFVVSSAVREFGPKGLDDIVVLDWTNLSGTFGKWADFAVDDLRLFLNDVVEMGSVDGREELRFNQLLRTHVLGEDGSLKLEFSDIRLDATFFNVSFSKAQVYGLDSVSTIHALTTVDSQQLSNQFNFKILRIVLDFDVIPTVHDNGETDSTRMRTTYSFRNVSTEFNVIAALVRKRLHEIKLGSILDTSRIFLCSMAGLHELELAKLQLSFGSIDNPVFEGNFFSTDARDSLGWIVQSTIDQYGAELIASIPLIAGSTLRDLFNSAFIPMYMDHAAVQCAAIPSSIPRDGWIDFRDLLLSEEASRSLGGQGNSKYGNLFRMLFDLTYEHILQSDLGWEDDSVKDTKINRLLGNWTRSQSNVTGALMFKGDVVAANASISIAGLNANATFIIRDVSVEGLNSMGSPLQLLQPVLGEPNFLRNLVSLGIGRTVRLTAAVVLAVSDGAQMKINNTLNIRLDLDTIVVMATFLLRIAEDSFVSVPMKDISNLNCWLAMILAKPQHEEEESARFRGLALVNHTLSARNVTLDISCISCTSPKFDQLLLALYSPSNATEAMHVLGEAIDRLLDSDFLQVLLDSIQVNSAKRCPHTSIYTSNQTEHVSLERPNNSLGISQYIERDKEAVFFTVSNSLFAAFLLVVALVCRFLVKKRNCEWIESLSDQGQILFRKQQDKKAEQEAFLIDATTSLFRSPCIRKEVRVLVPLAILLNIVLYMIGHLGTLSAVDLDVVLAGEAFKVYDFLEFSFIGATTRTYHNGGSEVAILAWIFTGIWPYFKLVASLVLWMLPPCKLTVANRGRILLWIDALATLSVVDVFTMIVAVAIMLIYFGGPDTSISTDGDFYSMKFIVRPHVGAYCMIVAQRMSRVSSRFLLDYHQRVIDAAFSEGGGESEEPEMEHQPHELRELAGPTRVSGLKQDDEETSSHDSAKRFDDRQADVITRKCRPNLNSQTEDCYSLVGSFKDKRSFSLPDDENGDQECSSSEDRTSFECHVPIIISTDNEETSSQTARGHFKRKFHSNDPMPENNEFSWGHLGMYFAGLTVGVVFVIGCIFAPSISLNISDVWRLALESGNTFEQAIMQYGVFSIVGSVLVEARFVLNSTADYAGLGLLLLVGILSAGMTFVVRLYQFVHRWMKERELHGACLSCTACSNWRQFCPWGVIGRETDNGSIPSYLRLYKWKNMEIYLISIAIGVWQLGAVSSYSIHLYCDVLRRLYAVLAYVGLVESSDVHCFREQATHAGNLVIILGAFLILLAAFTFQASTRSRKNVVYALSLLGNEVEVQQLSSVWNPDQGIHEKDSRCSSEAQQSYQEQHGELIDTGSLSS